MLSGGGRVAGSSASTFKLVGADERGPVAEARRTTGPRRTRWPGLVCGSLLDTLMLGLDAPLRLQLNAA
jgi:hypothetical protein